MSLERDADYFYKLQTQTGWGRTLARFAEWCAPEAGWRTLDVGCGPGLLPGLFARMGCRATGCDLDPAMFAPRETAFLPLHPQIAAADALALPFPGGCFDLVTASNLLFLLPDPAAALSEIVRVTRPGGQVAVLNPSERMNVAAAAALAEERGLDGLGRETLINYAARAERHHRWGPEQLDTLFRAAGLQLVEGALRMGPGLVRFGKGAHIER